jgi:hypothetical protein
LYEISIGTGALNEYIESTGFFFIWYGYYELASITTMKGYGRRANRRFKKTAKKIECYYS